MSRDSLFDSWPEAGVGSHYDFQSITNRSLMNPSGSLPGLGTGSGCSYPGVVHHQIDIGHSLTKLLCIHTLELEPLTPAFTVLLTTKTHQRER